METFEITVDDRCYGRLVFDGLEAGPPAGELVLLLHGFPQTAWCWRNQLPVLAAAGYHAIAPNQRGYAPGARPIDVAAYSSAALTQDVLAIADTFGAHRFHLVGHDWGGAIAWQVAGRFGHRLRSLTVLSTPHPKAFGMALGVVGDSGPTDQVQRSSYIEIFRAEGSELGMLANEAAGLRLVLEGTGLSHEQAAPYLDALGTPEALRAALNWYRAADLSLVEGLGPIKTPTLYVWSTEDPALGPDAARATANCVEGPYRFEVLKGVSHWIAEQAPEELNRLLLDHLRTATD
ncbi:MAG: alpha/beta hydrolase [Acidimicrobiales bacterium]|nr:alpha/beta hydrolase [Acidimicrobiales bacterium]